MTEAKIENPENKDRITRFWLRIAEVKQLTSCLPRVLKLVWSANPLLTFLLLITEIVMGLAPLANVTVYKIIFDALPGVIASTHHSQIPFSLTNLPPAIFGGLALLAVTWFASEIMLPVQTFCRAQLNDCLSRNITLLVIDKVSSMVDITVLENPKFYDNLQRIQSELGYRPIQILFMFSNLGKAFVTLLSLSILLCKLSPVVVLMIFTLCGPCVLFQIKRVYEEWQVFDGDVPEVRRMRYYTQVLTANTEGKEIRLFGLNSFFRDQYLGLFATFQKRRSSMRKSHLLQYSLLVTISTLATVSSYIFAVIQAVNGRITTGSMAMYLSTISQMQQYLMDAAFATSELYMQLKYMNLLFEFLATPSAIPVLNIANKGIRVETPLREGIEFRNVSFKYPDSERMILDDVSFKMLPTQTIALVGENGAGKTTIVKLLSRLYDPTAGQILIDGIDLKDLDPEHWRSLMSVVFQDYCRFHLTVGQNIGIGKINEIDNLEAIKIAAERGGAAAIIDKLEQNYQTMLGKNFEKDAVSTELSGGEWQKIALSRAFMRSNGITPGSAGSLPASEDSKSRRAAGAPRQDATNPGAGTANSDDAQLLILDEPTASLDVQSEYDVYCRFHELTAGKMALLITHRFSTVRIADRILVLEHGKIIEDGSHDQLVSTESTYSRLYNLQADRYK